MKPPDALRQRVLATFADSFGGTPTLIARAPGRVNLIGEHTDYNDGFVLPCAIGFATLVAARPRADRLVRVVAADEGHTLASFDASAPFERHAEQPWVDYVRGVYATMARRGIAAGGAELAIAGDVPRGAGLSSSASLEVAIGLAIRELQPALAPTLDLTTLARIGQQAENEFVGCACGIMDQLVSAQGKAGHALLIDCRSLATTAVPVPEGLVIMVVHSNVQRGLVDSAYNERRRQCQEAASGLGVAALRDAELPLLQARHSALDPLAFRRARHVISENERTLAAAAAFRGGRLDELGELMAASHASMRDDFQITVPAIDQLVALLQQAIGRRGGARMTGGGFGGCVVAVMEAERAAMVAEQVAAGYRYNDGSPDGRAGTVWLCTASAGAGRID